MNAQSTLPLFRISLAGMFSRGSCWLLLLGGVLFAWLAPLVTPWEENPIVLEPARAQAAWVYAWIALFTWLPFQAASLGHRMRKEGLLEHLRAGRQAVWSLCLQISGAVVVWLLALALLATTVALVFCRPANADEASLWTNLVQQYLLLYGISAIPLVVLGVALGTRTSEVIAFLVPVGLLFLGLFGGAWLGPVLAGSHSPILQALWLALPHYHLADLTPRLVFKMGPLPMSDFLQSVLCLGLMGLTLCSLSLCLFRTRS